MGIDMYLEQSQLQSSSVATMCQSQEAAYQDLQSAIQKFSEDTESLKGDAYDSARSFFASVLLPLSKGGQLYAENFSQAIKKLPADYQTMVDSKSWREDDLLDKIRQEEQMIAYLDEVNQSLSSLTMDSEEKGRLRRSNVELMRGHHANKRVYETILRDLRAYDSYSGGLFDELDSIDVQLSRGLAQIESSWDAKTGVFKIPSDLTWANYLSAYSDTKDMKHSRQEKAFVQTMMAEYGFDAETAQQLLTIKQGIDRKFPTSSQGFRDYIFLRVVGAAYYDGFQWNETAGHLKTYFYNVTVGSSITGKSRTVEKPLLEIFKELGIKEETDAKKLIYNLRLQHEMAGGDYKKAKQIKQFDYKFYEKAKITYDSIYGSSADFDQFWNTKLKAYSNNGAGHADFTHQSITMATHLNPNQVQLSDVYGGREHVRDLSGWEGDTTFNATDKKPSIGEDDYKADLDSVNLIGRMQKGQSYDQAISSYYADLQKDSSVREREFLQNKDWKQVRSTIYASILPLEVMEKGEDAIKAYIESNYQGVSKFLNRLEAVAD
ncbi:WXG superfamily LXG domain protein [Streptococcus oralis SK304]|uniref:WXG superfamily LXG domain protein n=1 Tax=Streptococcus oralis SK304 TaxID=1161421 RepID=J4K8U6_STROR|nr:T7SS effector LXG polymorphic toxin [Streptococcus oralis]EJP21636.1 WXG superfamily LXG domain protein [Streptococcus oralis SK304]